MEATQLELGQPNTARRCRWVFEPASTSTIQPHHVNSQYKPDWEERGITSYGNDRSEPARSSFMTSTQIVPTLLDLNVSDLYTPSSTILIGLEI